MEKCEFVLRVIVVLLTIVILFLLIEQRIA